MTQEQYSAAIRGMNYPVCVIHETVRSVTWKENNTIDHYDYSLEQCKDAGTFREYMRLSGLELGRQLIERGFNVTQFPEEIGQWIKRWSLGER